jgi:hypothetical protein
MMLVVFVEVEKKHVFTLEVDVLTFVTYLTKEPYDTSRYHPFYGPFCSCFEASFT